MAAASGTVWCVFSVANWSPISDSALLLQRAPSPFNFLPTRTFGSSGVGIRANSLRIGPHSPPPPLAVMSFSESPIVRDAAATLISGSVALLLLRLWKETARRKFFDQGSEQFSELGISKAFFHTVGINLKFEPEKKNKLSGCYNGQLSYNVGASTLIGEGWFVPSYTAARPQWRRVQAASSKRGKAAVLVFCAENRGPLKAGGEGKVLAQQHQQRKGWVHSSDGCVIFVILKVEAEASFIWGNGLHYKEEKATYNEDVLNVTRT